MYPTSENSGNVPAFLLKLWALVEDKTCDDLISWDATGKSFHVLDQARFAKEVLPHYFKHNNISSFIRQLNMYGFRKVGAIEQGALKVEKDDVEFQHPYFQKEEIKLLDFIKRRTSNPKNDSLKYLHDDVSDLLCDVHSIKGKQETVSNKLEQLRGENEVLWREVANLRQKHSKQQQIVNKLIQFLVTLAGGNRGLSGMKRKMQLMIEEPGSQPATKMPKLNRPLSITENKNPYSVQSPSSLELVNQSGESTGPIIHDVTDVYHDNTNNSSPLLPEQLNTTSVSSEVNNIQQTPPEQPPQLAPPELEADTSNQVAVLDSSGFSDILYSLMSPPATATSSSTFTKEQLQQQQQSVPSSVPISVTPTSMAVCASTSTNPLCPKREVNEQLDLMQKDLDGLKEFLSGEHFNLDNNILLNLFSPDSQLPEPLFDSDQLTHVNNSSTDVAGNELMHFNPSDGVPMNLFDLTDESGDLDPDLVDNLPMAGFSELNTPSVQQTPQNIFKTISTEDLD